VCAEWLTCARRSFGKPGTPFDWSKVDPKALRERAEQLEAEQKKDRKKVNPKAVALLEGCGWSFEARARVADVHAGRKSRRAS
jgi:hypothetical protein